MNARIRPGRFKVLWCVAGITVLPFSAVLATLIAYLINAFNIEIAAPPVPDSWASALAIYWLVNGFCIGFLQKAIVKRNLRVDLGRWTVYSSLGALLAGALASPCLEGSCLPPQFYDYRLAPETTATVELSLVALVYLTVFSSVQALALSRLVNGSWRWIAAHAGPLMFVAVASVAEQNLPGSSFFNFWLTFALYVLVVTAATGIVMQRLLTKNRRATKEAHDDWAYQPAAIEAESALERSVWDDAM